jgi:hypothetical protein
MRMAYTAWRDAGTHPQEFVWRESSEEDPFTDMVQTVTKSLAAEGIYRPGNLGDIAEKRLLRAIRLLGPGLFPLIKEAEVRLDGVRTYSGSEDLYQVTGVVDVLAAAPFSTYEEGENAIVDGMRRVMSLEGVVTDAEVIVDYKGISKQDRSAMLEVGRRQLLTYSWLRNHSVGERRVAGGILIFVNDLLEPEGDPTEDLNEPDLVELLLEASDVVDWTEELETDALDFFDTTVRDIETRLASERGQPLVATWEPRAERKTCSACDGRWHCPGSDFDSGAKTRPVAPSAP